MKNLEHMVDKTAEKLGIELDDECDLVDLDEDSINGLICPSKKYEDLFTTKGEDCERQPKCYRVTEWIKNNDPNITTLTRDQLVWQNSGDNAFLNAEYESGLGALDASSIFKFYP